MSALVEPGGVEVRRVALAGVLFLVLGLTPPVLLGLRSVDPQAALPAAVALAFVALGLRAASSSAFHLSRASARAVALLAVATPLLGATTLESEAREILSAWPCSLLTFGVAGAATISARLVLGEGRRRSGGATPLLAAGAALVGALASGLHCPAEGAGHLALHVLGAALVGIGLRRWLLA